MACVWFKRLMRYFHLIEDKWKVLDKNSPNYDKVYKVCWLLDVMHATLIKNIGIIMSEL